MWTRSLAWADPLEEGMVTHSTILPWRIPQMEEPSRLWSVGSQRAEHSWSNLACKHTQWVPYHVVSHFPCLDVTFHLTVAFRQVWNYSTRRIRKRLLFLYLAHGRMDRLLWSILKLTQDESAKLWNYGTEFLEPQCMGTQGWSIHLAMSRPSLSKHKFLYGLWEWGT